MTLNPDEWCKEPGHIHRQPCKRPVTHAIDCDLDEDCSCDLSA